MFARPRFFPQRSLFVDALPRNALGKVLKYRVHEGPIEPEERIWEPRNGR